MNEYVEMDRDAAMKLFGIKHVTTVDVVDKLCNITTDDCHKQCKVILNTGKRCLRNEKEKGLCTTHYNHYKKNQITDEDILKIENISRFEGFVEKMRESRKIPKLVQTKLIFKNSTDYLYDPFTTFVYDIDTYEKIGRMDTCKQLKLYDIKK
jgi:hypothetical protein